MEKELYQWQEECLERWFANSGRGIVQAVTGSGKTLLALTAACRLQKRLQQSLRVKIVVPTSSLMLQWSRILREFIAASGEADLQGKIGLRGGGSKSSADCKYMIYVINSARYELARQILTELKNGEAVYLIADECHHYISGQNRLIFEFLPYIEPYEQQFFSLGITATLPSGQAQHELAAVLGKRIYSYGMREASAFHTICEYDIFHMELSFEKEEKEAYDEMSEQLRKSYRRLVQIYPFLSSMGQKERYEMLNRLCSDKDPVTAKRASEYIRLTYKRTSLVCLASARTACAYCLLELLMQRLMSDERILVFGERISQAEELYQMLQERYPGRAGRYHSKMGGQANKNVMERFRVGDIRILITCKSLDEGIDIPDVSAGIILSGTSAMRQRIQRLGRIIRKKEGKNRAQLYYLHLSDSSEESYFLPEHGESRSFDLEFLSDKQKFRHPLYDKAAGRMLRKMWLAGAQREQIREAGRCLLAGSVRADWLLEKSEIEKQISEAKYVSEKNYWICMKKLGEMQTYHDSNSANKSAVKAQQSRHRV